MEQEVRFVTTGDGVRIAYATAGQGPPLVKTANWLNHLEYDWNSPLWRPLLIDLAQDFRLIRYDERGNGLSDWNVPEFSLEVFVHDLEAVVDAAGLEQFDLFGISQGGAVSIAYAVRHPERVRRLILYGAYARGWQARQNPDEIRMRQALSTLVEQGWGKDHPAFRQMWTSLYIPGGTPEQMEWFNQMQRVSTSPEIATRLLRTFREMDVSALLPQVRTPTLVLHATGDLAVPYSEGRQLAAGIAGARFVSLQSNNHIPLPHEDAWGQISAEIRRFVGIAPRTAQRPAAPSPEATAGPAPGTKFGRYQILSRIGAGGMGEVYRARDTKLERDVALKILPEKFASDPERLARFEREARAASALNHPNIITVYDVGAHAGLHYIAMEFLEGETLEKKVAAGRLPVDTALRLASQMAQALAKAHAAGIVHRDLKPANIFVTADGFVKILDFGIAKLRSTGLHEAETAVSKEFETQKYTVMGTAEFMSPEQSLGEEVDFRSDQFSFGCVLYLMLTGVSPFRRANAALSMRAIREEEPEPAPRLNPDVFFGLDVVLRRCLEKEPARRFDSTERLARALEGISLEFTLDSLRPAKPAEPARSPQPAYSAGAGGEAAPSPRRKYKWLWRGLAIVIVALLFAVAYQQNLGGLRQKLFPSRAATEEIRSLAILPFRAVSAQPGDDLLGTGMADTMITKVSQMGAITVRPTSAVRRFAAQDVDSLAAGKQLQVDAVLDGTVQRSGSVLRLNLNLLRVRDGASLWSDSLDVESGDVFAMQDQVSQKVAGALRLKLSGEAAARWNKRYTSNPEAYEYYLKGMRSFDRRGITSDWKPELLNAATMFQRAIQLDSNYALAHARLANVYAFLAVLVDPDPKWLQAAIDELARAEALDSGLAETHIVRYELLWSHYEGFQVAEAIRQLREAAKIDPNASHSDLALLYHHVGLEEPSLREMERALQVDPTSEVNWWRHAEVYDMLVRPDEAIAVNRRYSEYSGTSYYVRKSYLWKQDWATVRREMEAALRRNPNDPFPHSTLALLAALQGDFRPFEQQKNDLLARNKNTRAYHHTTYNLACVYALQGKAAQAVELLQVTADTGMPSYTLFSRDPHLDRIRKEPAFVAFMDKMKTRYNEFAREFGN